jgi:hypothetical protein
MTSRGAISKWFDEGVEAGAAFMIIKWDTFDGPDGDYPVYVMPGESPHEVSSRIGDMTMECYCLLMDKKSQLDEHRAQHWTLPEPPAPTEPEEEPVTPAETPDDETAAALLSSVTEGFIGLHEMFLSMQASGFTASQALYLTGQIIREQVAQNSPGPGTTTDTK